jgi:hypothetical protein
MGRKRGSKSKSPERPSGAESGSKEPLVLYSTVTWLAFSIGENYYGGVHYVWCSPYFDVNSVPTSVRLPPTSNPKEIYESLNKEVQAGDAHSAKIAANRVGILKGAAAKRKAGVISDRQYQAISAIVAGQQLLTFARCCS